MSIKRFINDCSYLISLKRAIPNSDELKYVRAELNRYNDSLVVIVIVSAILASAILALVLDPLFLPKSISIRLMFVHIYDVTAAVTAIFFVKKKALIRGAVTIIQLGVCVNYAIFLSYQTTAYSADTLYLLSITQLFCFFVAITCPIYNAWLFALINISFECLMLWTTRNLPQGILVSSVQTILLTVAMVFRYSTTLSTVRNSLKQIRLLLSIAPAQVVVRSVRENKEVSELFAPMTRPCVCLSSDWRKYQALTGKIDGEKISGLLSHYYHEVGKILMKNIPKGNFYIDWIADELFMVCYVETEKDLCLAVSEVLNAALDMLRCKSKAFSAFETPPGIDIGIAVGEAFVGMIGPPEHKKATALGETPGRSRRLQTAAKFLRSTMGEKDRIFFGKDTMAYAEGDFDIFAAALDPDIILRDLPDRLLYFMEAGEKSSQSADRASIATSQEELIKNAG